MQIKLLQTASPARRLALARSLSASVISLSRRAIRREHPELSDQEVLIEFVALTYGESLARRLREDLARRVAGEPA